MGGKSSVFTSFQPKPIHLPDHINGERSFSMFFNLKFLWTTFSEILPSSDTFVTSTTIHHLPLTYPSIHVAYRQRSVPNS